MDSKLRHQQQYQQQHLNSGLMRFQSAPSSLLASLIGGESEGYDEFLHRSSRPEAENMISRFMSGELDDKLQRSPEFVEAIEQEQNRFLSASEMMYQTEQLPDHSSAAAAAVIDNSCRVMNSIPMESPELAKGSGNGSNLIRHNSSAAAAMIDNSCQVMNSIPRDSPELAKGRGNGSNLIRHNSSPAGLFSNLTVENGYAVMKGMGNFRVGSGSDREAGLSSSRLRNQTNFIPRQANSPPMSQLSEMGTEGISASFPISTWDDSPVVENLTGLKRRTDIDDALGGDACNRTTGLSHQYSFPKTSLEMAAMEKFLQFQDSVPCKVRAKRGYATHPRSIAERVRRTRISERMRKLQELVPNMDKQTNTADMLDLAVEYIKDLQKEMKTLLDDGATCTCSSKNKPNSNPTV